MLGGRSKLPVLAEISGPGREQSGLWSLRRADHRQMEEVVSRLVTSRVVLVSGDEETGRLVALSCAASCAAAGRRTVLVECSLERPRLAAELGLPEAPGLHEYLRWEAKPEEIVRPVVLTGPAAQGSEHLTVVVAGRPAPDASTLLGLQSFSHVAEKLRHAYEQVVIAGPPALAAPESLRAVAVQADTVLAGMAREQVRGRRGKPLRSALRALPAPVLGAVTVATGAP